MCFFKVLLPPRPHSLNSIVHILAITEDCYAVILARVGWDDQKIVTGKISTLLNADVGPPIHSLVIPGEMHFLENDMLKLFAVNKEDF